ncbi:MAG: VCBS repeat-containing protein [Bacteroidota bacterium]
MDRSILSLILLTNIFFWTFSFGQGNFEFSYLTPDTEDGGLTFFFDLKDIDNDGDLDVISSATSGPSITWNENLNGFGEFSTMRIVDNTLEGAYSLEGVNFDNDGDVDIVASLNDSTFPLHSEVIWYENLNGNGQFSQ